MKYIILSILLFSILFGVPGSSNAQAPTLGTASNFVLFSSTGAVGNTGAVSHFTGDIGTVVGAVTINVNVNGILRFAGSAASSQAAADVLAASHQLDLTTPTFVTPNAPAGVDSLGGNHTMLAGVDSLAQNTLIDSALTLDGQGNQNSVFIFKINGTLSTTPAARIILINGALACNVFWQTAGAVNMGAGSIMRGTILAKNATINMDNGATLEGRALTVTSGAITTTNVLTYTPTGCGSPVHLGPAAPSLATTACYVLFSSNGTVSNAGTSYMTGDVGSNLGTTSGYNPLFVTGMIHPSPDPSTAQCAADLNNVHTVLFNQPADIELLFPAQFGQNLVLTPHTYLLNSATALTDTLYLNAEGNANAVFLIKVTGAFSTSVKARVILTNGTKASNVFWNVEGAISLSDSSVMRGTFIANNGAITMTTGALLDGRALTTTGALSTAAVTATIPPGTCAAAPLPLKLLSFSAQKASGATNRISWATAVEDAGTRFGITRSANGSSFENIGSRAGTGGQSAYTFYDEQPLAGTNYYRLMITEAGGRAYYSSIAVLGNRLSGSIVVAPVPAGNSITITNTDGALNGQAVSICSMEGRIVCRFVMDATQTIDISSWAPGTYAMRLPGAEVLRVVKQ